MKRPDGRLVAAWFPCCSSRGSQPDRKLAGHTAGPTTVDWDRDGRRELTLDAEDGHLYRLVEATLNG